VSTQPTGKSSRFDELVALRYDLALDIYRQRARALEVDAASRKGRSLEYWVYRVFGNSLIPSLALTLNPYWQFDTDLRERSNKIVPMIYPQTPVAPNRTRTFPTLYGSALKSRLRTEMLTTANYRKWNGKGYEIAQYPDVHTVSSNLYTLGYQNTITGFVKDTTWKSRNPRAVKIPFNRKDRDKLGLQSQGEFEMWYPRFEALSPGCSWDSHIYTYNDLQVPLTTSVSRNSKSVSILGASASCDNTYVQSAANFERLNAISVFAKNMDSLVGRCLPTRRLYNSFYQLAELKDLPQTLRGTLTAWKHIEDLIGFDDWARALSSPSFWSPSKIRELALSLRQVNVILNLDHLASDAYLTFKFGWESMYQAVKSLMGKPAWAAREVNTLIANNGKLMTLSTGFTLPEGEWTSYPSITAYCPNGMSIDPDDPFSQKGRRRVRLRCVVNSGVRLPELDIPSLRTKLVADKLGEFPRPSDIYNLIPWTWLIDWFSGCSSYLRLLEEVQGDRTLINYGFLTYVSEVESTATLGCYASTSDDYHWSSGANFSSPVKPRLRVGGKFTGAYQLRISVSSLASVKTLAGKGLSQTQLAILEALLMKFL